MIHRLSRGQFPARFSRDHMGQLSPLTTTGLGTRLLKTHNLEIRETVCVICYEQNLYCKNRILFKYLYCLTFHSETSVRIFLVLNIFSKFIKLYLTHFQKKKYIFNTKNITCFVTYTCQGASMAEWLETLTYNHLPLTATKSRQGLRIFHVRKLLTERRWFYSGARSCLK